MEQALEQNRPLTKDEIAYLKKMEREAIENDFRCVEIQRSMLAAFLATLDVDRARIAVLEEERRSGIEYRTVLKDLTEFQKAKIAALENEVAGLRAFKRSVDVALNSGDGSYRP